MPRRPRPGPTASMVEVVESTVLALGDALKPADAAAVGLARLYALRLDQAAPLESEIEVVAGCVYEYTDLTREVDRLTRKVNGSVILNNLGPKLLDVLAELGATVKARGVIKPAPGEIPPAPAVPDPATLPANVSPPSVLANLRAGKVPTP